MHAQNEECVIQRGLTKVFLVNECPFIMKVHYIYDIYIYIYENNL